MSSTNRWVIAVVVLCLSGPVWSQDEVSRRELSLPHAGLKLTLPEDFTLQAPSQEFDLLQAVESSEAGALKMLRLRLTRVDADTSPEEILDKAYIAMRKDRSYVRLSEITSASVQVADRPAHLNVVRYGQADQTLYTGQVCFVRSAGQEESQLACVLTVTAKASQKAGLIPILRELSESLSLMDLEPVSQVEFPLVSDPVVDQRMAASLRAPLGWYVYATQLGLRAEVMDYAKGLRGAIGSELLALRQEGTTTVADQIESLRERFEQARSELKAQGEENPTLPKIEEVTDASLGVLSGKRVLIRGREGLTIRTLATRSHGNDTLLYVLDVRPGIEELEARALTLSKKISQGVTLNDIPEPTQDSQTPAP